VPKIIKFVDAFMCYKQNSKVVSLNLAHPVECDTENLQMVGHCVEMVSKY